MSPKPLTAEISAAQSTFHHPTAVLYTFGSGLIIAHAIGMAQAPPPLPLQPQQPPQQQPQPKKPKIG